MMWSTFGVPAHQWDHLNVGDLQWMMATIDRQRQQEQAEQAKLRNMRG